MKVETYLAFEGKCEEAFNFYRDTIGAEIVTMMRFKDSPDPNACGENLADKIMHGAMRIGDTTIMASDGRCQQAANFQGFSLCITVPDEASADRLFSGLAKTGTVVMPLTKTFFSPKFGMVTDKFGISWMIIIQ